MGALCAGATGAAQEVSGLDLSLLDDWLTPNELFFVRDHGAAPATAGSGWSLPVSGLVAKPFDLQPDELERLTRKRIAATLDCAEQPAGGGLFSTAEWTGVPLWLVLEKAAVEPGARAVRLTGAGGYTRTLPIAKAMHADTLLADRMNGARLPNAHGY
ncbi:MAG: molybdopterin-dependent oxidoreductase, partial [Candidatus Solibacter usitatus]|nr:molybdopterin-dependent oxidoreductase [Candidatus Solibacter usitatus]